MKEPSSLKYLPLYIWPMTFVVAFLLSAGFVRLVEAIHYRLVTGSI